MRIILILFCIILATFSCKKWTKVYDANGNIIAKFAKLNDSISKGIYYYSTGKMEKELYIKNLMYDGCAKFYYTNGKLKQKGEFNKYKKTGWWYTYDSVTQRIIEKAYYIKNGRYTYVKLNTDGTCKYYEIRPHLENVKGDTLYVNKTDSIPIKFYKAKERLDIKEFITKIYPVTKNENIIFSVSKANSKYIYFNVNGTYSEGGLYYIEYEAMQMKGEKICCCDSVFFDYSNKFIYIND